jgi:poly(A) polymerase
VSQPAQPPIQPRVYSRDQHPISRAAISDNALKVLYRLRDAGFRSCLVGGGVRDLLLGREPKDFDVATDAHPDDVRRLFRNCRLIGRRFRLAHVTFGREVIEVATFRAPFDAENEEGNVELSDDGRILRDNCYGTIEQDAWRRDFTVNALYYDIADYSVLDFTNGVRDLHEGVLRLIGDDPEQRLREDPVRMLRAVRFAAKLGLRIAPEVDEVLHRHAALMSSAAPARLFDEVLKLFHSGAAVTCLDELERFGLFEAMFPQTAACFAKPDQGPMLRAFLVEALKNTDLRVRDGLGVHPAFLYAALLWAPMQRELKACLETEEEPVAAWQKAASIVLEKQSQRVTIPRRFALVVREIWEQQDRLPRSEGARAARLLTHPRFRAGYDFLCLRARAGQADSALCQWWTEFQESDEGRQQEMLRPAAGESTATRPRRRRRRKPRSAS